VSHTPYSEPSKARPAKPIRLWHLGLWFVIASLAIGALVGLFTFILRGSFWPWDLQQPLQTTELQQVVQSAVTSAAALGLGVTLYLSFRRQKSTDDSYATTLELLRLQQDQHRSDRITKLRDRYVSAADQFGSDSRPIRLAGIYSLASLADDWSEDQNVKERQVCIDLLTSYLALGSDDGDTTETRGPEWETIWSTIFERAVLERKNPGWPGANVRIRNVKLQNYLAGLRFDFGALSFSGSPVGLMVFDGCHFELSDVTFDSHLADGRLEFRNCRFSGGKLSMNWHREFDAKVKSERLEVEFFNCSFEGTILQIDGDVTDGGYSFNHCHFAAESPGFEGKPTLRYIEMGHCEFNSDPLRSLWLQGTKMVEIGGHDDDHSTVKAMAKKYNGPSDKMH